MKLKEIKKILNADLLWGEKYLERNIDMANSSDLLSDILAFSKAGTLLLTGLVNLQVIRTAEMIEIAAICFVRGKKPDKAAVKLAISKGIPLLYTKLHMFESCGRLYKNGLKNGITS